MNLFEQCNEIPRPETKREMVWLVSRMMRYRMDIITGLEEEVCTLMQEMRAPGSLRKVRRTARRLALLTARIGQLAQDNEYDALSLGVALRFRLDSGGVGPEGAQDDQVRYIT